MKDINKFTSNNKYIFIPTKNNPKVILAVDNIVIRKNSFKLYNPFSKKARVFKNILEKFCMLPGVCTFLSKGFKNSEFIKCLNKKFNKKFISSIYIATEKDKVVLQFQSNNNIFGYVKYPLNEIGKERILNEKEAFDIFFKKGIIDNYLLFNFFEKKPFLVLKALEGKFTIYKKEEILKLLEKFTRNETFKLKTHPRIEKIASFLEKDKFMYEKFFILINQSVKDYKLVYEHGDFAPWNIIKKDNRLIPFDFEYFEKDGLEWMDFIKYYYQIGKLLKKYKNEDLINYIFNYLTFEEKDIVLGVFIFKEIAMKIKENKNYDYELNILKSMEVI